MPDPIYAGGKRGKLTTFIFLRKGKAMISTCTTNPFATTQSFEILRSKNGARISETKRDGKFFNIEKIKAPGGIYFRLETKLDGNEIDSSQLIISPKEDPSLCEKIIINASGYPKYYRKNTGDCSIFGAIIWLKRKLEIEYCETFSANPDSRYFSPFGLAWYYLDLLDDNELEAEAFEKEREYLKKNPGVY